MRGQRFVIAVGRGEMADPTRGVDFKNAPEIERKKQNHEEQENNKKRILKLNAPTYRVARTAGEHRDER